MTSEIPQGPPGFVCAGPTSDFLLTEVRAESNALDGAHVMDLTSLHSSSLSEARLVGCPVTQAMANPSVAVSGEKTTIEAGQICGHTPSSLIKVIEIPQPAGRYPPTKRVAVTHFHGKWYAFINVSRLLH